MEIRIPNAPVKIMFFVHLVFTSWGMQAYWRPESYVYYNLIFLATVLWSIHSKESEEAPFMAMGIDAVCIILDIVALSIYFPVSTATSERFSVGMAIVNLVLRPLSCLVLFRMFNERRGNMTSFGGGGNYGNIFGTSGRSVYEDIDNAPQSGPPGGPNPSSPSYGGGGASPSEKVPPPYHG